MPPGTKNKIKKVTSIGDLIYRCGSDQPDNDKYQRLAISAAKNLGYGMGDPTLDQAFEWLKTNAMETTEKGVVGEINFCIPLI